MELQGRVALIDTVHGDSSSVGIARQRQLSVHQIQTSCRCGLRLSGYHRQPTAVGFGSGEQQLVFVSPLEEIGGQRARSHHLPTDAYRRALRMGGECHRCPTWLELGPQGFSRSCPSDLDAAPKILVTLGTDENRMLPRRQLYLGKGSGADLLSVDRNKRTSFRYGCDQEHSRPLFESEAKVLVTFFGDDDERLQSSIAFLLDHHRVDSGPQQEAAGNLEDREGSIERHPSLPRVGLHSNRAGGEDEPGGRRQKKKAGPEEDLSRSKRAPGTTVAGQANGLEGDRLDRRSPHLSVRQPSS